MSLAGLHRFAPGEPVKPCLRMVARDFAGGFWPWGPSYEAIEREYRKLVVRWEEANGRPLTDGDVWENR